MRRASIDVVAEHDRAAPQLGQQADLDELVGGPLDVADAVAEHPALGAAVHLGQRPDRGQRRAGLQHHGPRREVPAEHLTELVDAAARLERGGQLAGRVDPPGDDQLDGQAHPEQPEPVEQPARGPPAPGPVAPPSRRSAGRRAAARSTGCGRGGRWRASAFASSWRSVVAAWAIRPATGMTTWQRALMRGSARYLAAMRSAAAMAFVPRRADLVGPGQHADRVHRGAQRGDAVLERLEERQVHRVQVAHQVDHRVGVARALLVGRQEALRCAAETSLGDRGQTRACRSARRRAGAPTAIRRRRTGCRRRGGRRA